MVPNRYRLTVGSPVFGRLTRAPGHPTTSGCTAVQALFGVTRPGKSFTVANVTQNVNEPTLIFSRSAPRPKLSDGGRRTSYNR